MTVIDTGVNNNQLSEIPGIPSFIYNPQADGSTLTCPQTAQTITAPDNTGAVFFFIPRF